MGLQPLLLLRNGNARGSLKTYPKLVVIIVRFKGGNGWVRSLLLSSNGKARVSL